MKKLINYSLAVILFATIGCNQDNKATRNVNAEVKPSVDKIAYSGKYEITYAGTGSGEINIWKLENDSTAIFNIDLFNGKNLGGLVGKMNIKNNVGIFDANSQIDSCFCECILRFDFRPKTVEVSSVNSDCGFGHGVFGDGVYKKVGKDIPNYFLETGTGDTIYFSKIKELFDRK